MRSAPARVFIFLLVFSCALPAVVSAQNFEDEEMELFFAPAETITTASRHAQPIAQSPSAVTVITREDIEASGARTLPEALRGVPNLDVYLMKPLWYSVGARGRTAEESDKILLLVDGRNVTSEMIGSPFWTLQYFSMDEVERIEVIRGPGSALYGSNAYSGVVNVITREAGKGPAASVSIRGGEHGFTELAAHGGHAFEGFALGASAGWTHEDLWTGRDVDARDQTRGRLHGSIDLGPDGKLVFDGGVMQTGGLVHSALGTLHARDSLDAYGRLQLDYQDLIVHAFYNRTYLDAVIDLALRMKDLDLTLAEAPPITGHVDKTSLLVQHSIEFFHNRLTYGAEYAFNHYTAEALVDEHHYEHRVGVYLQDEINLSDMIEQLWDTGIPTLILTAGLRFDYNVVSEWSEWELSPRVAVVFMPTPEHSLRVGYSRAFLKPTFIQTSLHIELVDVNNLGFRDLNTANADLVNQTVDCVDMGYKGHFFDNRLILEVDLAFNWYRDNIWFTYKEDEMEYIDVGELHIPDINGPGYGFFNEPNGTDGHNLEVTATWRPTERWRLFASAGYRQIFDNQTGTLFEREPIWGAALGSDLALGFGLTASARAFFTSSYVRYVSNPDGFLEPEIRAEIPSAWFLNARVAYTFEAAGLGEVTLGLEGFNILGFHFRQLGGISRPNQPDLSAEQLNRRIILFFNARI
jgi:outer membrane receptor protein involved in Fe transport